MIELTKAQIDVLGRPNFACRGIAHFLVAKGIYKKPEPLKAESEQAIVIHFLNGFVEKYGDSWAVEAERYLESLRTTTAEEGTHE